MNIVVTGGHLTPAYGFIEEAISRQAKVVVIGSLGPNSLEAAEFAKLNTPYYSIYPIKYNRYHKLTSIVKLPALIVPIIQSIHLLRRLKPDRVLVFGSFTALPVALAAKSLSIPVFMHEQTRTVGLANRLISRFADGCAVSYPETLSLIHSRYKRLTGNILRRSIWQAPSSAGLPLPTSHPILYITGGNQGSAAILTAIEPLIPELSKTYQLVIQIGRNHFPAFDSSHALIKNWFSADEVSWLLSQAKFVISRGGANTVAEIMAFGTPAIIVPLSQSSDDEQLKNAQILAEQAAAVIIPQSDLGSNTLRLAIHQLETDYSKYKQGAAALRHRQNPAAAAELYQFIQKFN